VRFPLESVPNFSEGRDRATIDALAAALAEHAELLDVHADPDHNRSVFTLVGSEEQLEEALLASVARALERIDLHRHVGAHPRIGAADVVPLVPIRPEDLSRAEAAARAVARRIGDELGLPVFLYGTVSPREHGPAFFRRGGPEELQRRLESGELRPDFGSSRLHPTAGAVLVGARRPLIAFNVGLDTGDVEVAQAIARAVREADGGFPGVRALGLDLAGAGRVQVSMNVENWEAAALHEILERIESEAAARGVEVIGSELVGLMPAGAAAAAAGSALKIDGFDASRVLELRVLDVDWPRDGPEDRGTADG
jgi:glutamate formiminotransferase